MSVLAHLRQAGGWQDAAKQIRVILTYSDKQPKYPNGMPWAEFWAALTRNYSADNARKAVDSLQRRGWLQQKGGKVYWIKP